MLSEYKWVDAVLERGTNSAYLMLFDLSCDSKIASGKNKIDGWNLSEKLAGLIGTRPDFRAELVRRYQDPNLGVCHCLIEQILVKCSDESIILVMVRNYVAKRKSFDGSLRTAIEGVALEQRPVSDWPGSYEFYGIAIPNLRKKLFEMAGNDSEERNLAFACLTAIDELRDKYGYVDSEPRHPDIESGRSWPLKIPMAVEAGAQPRIRSPFGS